MELQQENTEATEITTEEYYRSIIYITESEQHQSMVLTIEAVKFKKGKYYEDFFSYAKKLLINCIEQSNLRFNKQQIITHLDLSGITMKHVDTQFLKKIIVMFQNEFEDTLEKLIITNIPVFFKIAYKVIRPFVDKDTRKKIYFEKKSKKGTREFTNNDDIFEEI
jgi:hypothetical protein